MSVDKPASVGYDAKRESMDLLRSAEYSSLTSIGQPLSSIALPIVKTDRIDAILNHKPSSAKYRPGQILSHVNVSC